MRTQNLLSLPVAQTRKSEDHESHEAVTDAATKQEKGQNRQIVSTDVGKRWQKPKGYSQPAKDAGGNAR
jgi:hypothetical protein